MPGGDSNSRHGVEGRAEDIGCYVMSVAHSITGVDAYRIRRYEAKGLLKPARTEGGQRLFSDRDVRRIKEIAELENRGVNLKGVEIVLSMKGSGGLSDGGSND